VRSDLLLAVVVVVELKLEGSGGPDSNVSFTDSGLSMSSVGPDAGAILAVS
jgi:hypothetical protein